MVKKIIALYGAPRSGTSWLGQIIDSCPELVFRFQPLFSYRFKGRINPESSLEDINQFFDELYAEDNDEFLNQTDKRKNGGYPVFSKQNGSESILAYKEVRYLYTIPLLLEKCDNVKVIGLVRNPYDTMESWINAPSEYKEDWNLDHEWLFAPKKNGYRPESYYGYHKWKESIKMSVDMHNLYSDKFLLIRYEDLEENALELSRQLFDFSGISFTQQTEQFIKDSQSRTVLDSYSVYRDKSKERIRKCSLSEEIKEKIAYDLKGFEEAQFLGYGK